MNLADKVMWALFVYSLLLVFFIRHKQERELKMDIKPKQKEMEQLNFESVAYFWNEKEPKSAVVSRLKTITQSVDGIVYGCQNGKMYLYCSHENPIK